MKPLASFIFFFLNIASCFSQFIHPEFVFSRFDYYFSRTGIQIQYDLKVQDDTTSFRASNFQVVEIQLEFFPLNSENEHRSVRYSPQYSFESDSSLIKIDITDNPLNDSPLQNNNAGWAKIEAVLIHKLNLNDSKRESPKIVILRQMSSLENIFPTPSIPHSSFTHVDQDPKRIIIPMEFSPVYDGITIENCKIKQIGSNIYLNAIYSEELSNYIPHKRIHNIYLTSEQPIPANFYMVEVQYRYNEIPKSHELRDIKLEEPTPKFIISSLKSNEEEKISSLPVIEVSSFNRHTITMQASNPLSMAGLVLNRDTISGISSNQLATRFTFDPTDLNEGVNHYHIYAKDRYDQYLTQNLVFYKRTIKTVNSLAYYSELVPVNDRLKIKLGLINPSEEDKNYLKLVSHDGMPSLEINNGDTLFVWDIANSSIDSFEEKSFNFTYNNHDIFKFTTTVISNELNNQIIQVLADQMNVTQRDLNNLDSSAFVTNVVQELTERGFQIQSNKTLEQAINELANQALSIIRATRHVNNNQRERIDWRNVALSVSKIALRAFGIITV